MPSLNIEYEYGDIFVLFRSSVRAHLAAQDDGLVSVQPVLDRIADFASLVRTDADDPAFTALRAAEQTGRPLGKRRLCG